MADANIHYRLNLILRLVDTTTGRRIKERQVVFKTQNQVLMLQRKDDGVYILMNYPGKDLNLDISAEGFLPMQVEICLEELSQKLPEVEVPLIPVTDRNQFVDYLTLEGKKPGITSVTAVSIKNPHGELISYQPRRQSLKLYYAKAFEEQCYAVLHEEEQTFEEFKVVKMLDKLEIKLASPLGKECYPKEKLVRIVHGKVDSDGHYLLRVLEEGNSTEYLVRYVVNGKEIFKRFSFGSQEIAPDTEEGRS